MVTNTTPKVTVSDSELRDAIEVTEKRRNCPIDFNLAKAIIINISIRISDDYCQQMPYLKALEAVLTELYIKDKTTRSLYKSLAGTFFQPHSVRSRRTKRHTRKQKRGEKPKTQTEEFVPTINDESGQYDFGIGNYSSSLEQNDVTH